MTVEELEDEHSETFWMDDISNAINIHLHTKLSIQFAIEVLNDIAVIDIVNMPNEVYSKIRELKQYLDEKV